MMEIYSLNKVCLNKKRYILGILEASYISIFRLKEEICTLLGLLAKASPYQQAQDL